MTNPQTGSRDMYSHITELDGPEVAAIAERLDIRAADPSQRRLRDEYLARPSYAAGSVVLEIGSGTGAVTAQIAGLPGVARAVGIDPSPYFVDLAAGRYPELRFEVGDGRALPFEDESFDGIVFATTLCHIPGPEQALAEAFRVLEPGGSLLIFDGDYATVTVAVAPNDPLQTCVDATVDQLVHDPWTMRRLGQLVSAAGFEPGELHSHGHVELDSPTYMLALVGIGADALADAGTITAVTAGALRAEARDRAATGRFFGHIAYASLLARKPLGGSV
jgi:ubiquinone/menaquinone biosynthesis C-methylase UbiE